MQNLLPYRELLLKNIESVVKLAGNDAYVLRTSTEVTATLCELIQIPDEVLIQPLEAPLGVVTTAEHYKPGWFQDYDPWEGEGIPHKLIQAERTHLPWQPAQEPSWEEVARGIEESIKKVLKGTPPASGQSAALVYSPYMLLLWTTDSHRPYYTRHALTWIA